MLVDLRVQIAGHAPDRGGTRLCRDRVQCFVNQPLHLLEVLLHSSCNRRLRTQTLIYTSPGGPLASQTKRYGSENASSRLMNLPADLLDSRIVQAREFAIAQQVEHEICTP